MMFGRNSIFGVGNSWKKVVRQESAKRKVVLTKVTFLQNGSPCEDILSHPARAKTGNPEDNPARQTNNHPELSKSAFLSSFSEYATVNEPSNCIPKLYKSESEDSGVELPSDTNSASTPSGSEQSFGIHRRESSCDSGMALSVVSSSPAVQHCPFPAEYCSLEKCARADGKAGENQAVKAKKGHPASANWRRVSRSNTNLTQSPTVIDEEAMEHQRLSLVEILIADNNSQSPGSDGAENRNEDRLDRGTLKRQPSSDSLNDYMEECCRLSQVNQEKAGDRGSGLGYLEHICQLIETIGQLQDQNKQLQKQLWIAERTLKVNRMKEDFFLNHCCCGAVGIYRNLVSFPESRNGSSSNMTGNGNPFKGENTSQSTGRLHSSRGQGFDTGTAGRQTYREPVCGKMTNHHDVDLLHSHHAPSHPHPQHQEQQVVEDQASGKVNVLLRNSRLQTRPVPESSTLKRSCPQLYRLEDGSSNFLLKETNSASVWGMNRKGDWDHLP